MNQRMVALLLAVLAVTACDQKREAPDPNNEQQGTAAETSREPMAVQAEQLIWVYRARGNRQCENGGLTLETSTTSLTANGVDVEESTCGVRTDRMFPAVCGGQTGDVVLHLIPTASLDVALQQGFDPASQIQYQTSECKQAASSSPAPS